MPARSARLRSPLVRALVVFLVAFIGLCILAGPERLTRPSHDNHYSWLAQGWLEGRLHHEGTPPGYCSSELRRARKCRQHSYDDWARIWTLTLKDGSSVRGIPCKTEACEARRRSDRVESWLLLGSTRVLRELAPGEIVDRQETWYISFPPGPALAMLPSVALRGTKARDVLITCLLGALIPVVLLRLFDRERGLDDPARAREHLWAVAAWTFASPAAFVAANGRVWFTAQIVAALCLALYVSMSWRCHRPALAGLALALAVSCRPHLAVAVLFFAAEWWRETEGKQRWLTALRFAAPLLVVGAMLMTYNMARFDDPFEFGHRFLDIRWQKRMQEIGMFSTSYLGRNLRCAFTLMPVWSHGAGPWPGTLLGMGPTAAWSPKVSLHGSNLLLGIPWLLLLLRGRERCPQRWGLIAAAVAVAVPSLLYQNSGQIQFSYRFAIDWLPLLLPALVFSGGARRPWFPILVILAMAWQLHGAWWFGRAPGLLFVTDPLGWPFEAELQ
ncbi:MAG: hypothetical protein KC457_01160 [Myxococcales bacterium]|nr:hypothetical protein [Myxococcales bacterium]